MQTLIGQTFPLVYQSCFPSIPMPDCPSITTPNSFFFSSPNKAGWSSSQGIFVHKDGGSVSSVSKKGRRVPRTRTCAGRRGSRCRWLRRYGPAARAVSDTAQRGQNGRSLVRRHRSKAECLISLLSSQLLHRPVYPYSGIPKCWAVAST